MADILVQCACTLFYCTVLYGIIVQELLFKGPKLEIFGSRVYSQIRPVWIGVLGTRPKIQNFDGL